MPNLPVPVLVRFLAASALALMVSSASFVHAQDPDVPPDDRKYFRAPGRTGEPVINNHVLSGDLVVYRVYGDSSKARGTAEGTYYSLSPPDDSTRDGLALPPGNTMTKYDVVVLPKGTRVNFGVAAAVDYGDLGDKVREGGQPQLWVSQGEKAGTVLQTVSRTPLPASRAFSQPKSSTELWRTYSEPRTLRPPTQTAPPARQVTTTVVTDSGRVRQAVSEYGRFPGPVRAER